MDLKKFLGVTGYFHDHIRNYAEITRPLQQMVHDYERKRKLVWTEEGKIAFEKIKQAINNCPTLFFLDDISPIILETDASNYGIGGYLYQIVNGIENPTAFISKMLSEVESRWNTTEKEAYAIVFSLKNLAKSYMRSNIHVKNRS